VAPKDGIAFVQLHGIVLESARGPVPNLAEAIAGERIRGGWWGHPKGHDIFAATRVVRNSPDVLVCRFLGGKVTYIHRRLWPAIIRLADRLDKKRLAAILEEHTVSSAHRVVETPFPKWVPPEVKEIAAHLTEEESIATLGEQVVESIGSGAPRSRTKRRA
jgi:hypothetical protein